MEFFGRLPEDTSKNLEEFQVRVAEPGVSAETRAYAGCASAHPAPLFAELARDWKCASGDRYGSPLKAS